MFIAKLKEKSNQLLSSEQIEKEVGNFKKILIEVEYYRIEIEKLLSQFCWKVSSP